MKLTCLASGSSGNCYLLERNGEVLILDCGIPIKAIKKGLNWDISKVVGVVCTHGHSDHCKSVKDLRDMGIDVITPYDREWLHIEEDEPYPETMTFCNNDIFVIKPFALTDTRGTFKHTNADGTECPCYGFLISHPYIGRLLYITDTELVKWRFENINHILISCNYQKKYISDDNIAKKSHVYRGHMELDTVKSFVEANKSDTLKTVILCHLSDENADPSECVAEVQKAAGNGVYVDYARAGVEVELKGEWAMNISLKSLKIKNFKGIKGKEVDFAGSKVSVKGQNAAGKTSLFDALTWTLFNKDSLGNEKFSIRPLDKDSKQIDNVEIKVTAVLDVDGKEVELSKAQKQNWVTKRGTSEAVFQGNVNSYEIDGYPKTEKEYKAYISELVSEDIFKMITSPAYFPNLPWKEQRAILMRFADGASDVELAKENSEFADLVGELGKAPSTDDIQKKYQKALSEWKKQQAEIPVRIDELSSQKVDVDVDELELQKNSLKEQIAENKAKQEDISKGFADQDKIYGDISALKRQLQDMQIAANEENDKKRKHFEECVREWEFEARDCKDSMAVREKCIKSAKLELERLETELKECREKWKTIHDLVFDDSSLVCPYCKQEYTQEKKDALRAEFDGKKTKDLEDITNKGNEILKTVKEKKEEISDLESQIPFWENKLAEVTHNKEMYEKSLSELPTSIDISDTAEYKAIETEIKQKEDTMNKADGNADIRHDLMQRGEELQNQLTEVERQIAKIDQNGKIDERIAELQTEQREVSQKVADQEKMLYLLEQFIRFKMDKVSESINRKFDGISFRLFENQINGGLKETCECTVDGVPYGSLNNGHKIVAGLKIIKALQELYEASAPIFIDNAESMNDFNIPDMGCQMIMLSVSDDAELQIDTEG